MPNLAIERLSQKGMRDLNEDTLVIDQQHGVFGVFDGASSLTDYLTPDGKTGALVASETAAETFQTQRGDLQTVAEAANDAIEAAHEAADIDTSSSINRFSTTVAVAKIGETAIELLQIGDSIILAQHKDGSVTAPLGYHDHDMDVMRHWRQLADEGKTGIRELINDEVLALRSEANITYGVLNGSPEAAAMIKTTTLPRSDITRLLLITDGLYIPTADPEAPNDWAATMGICEAHGLEGLLQVVRAEENEDPEITKYPRYKLHDDATGIFIKLK